MVFDENIYYKLHKFPCEIWGIVYKCSFGCYHIGINKNLTREMQEKVLKHEIVHIKRDCPQKPYLIGLDMQHDDIENGFTEFWEEMSENNEIFTDT